MDADATFLLAWCGFVGLLLLLKALVIVWAVRTGQFRESDRVRSLPLIGRGSSASLVAHGTRREEGSE